MNDRPAEQGFALLEALIALALFAAMTGLFAQVVSSTAMAARHAALGESAALIAQSQLALAVETDHTGRSGSNPNLTWRTEIAPYSAGPDGARVEEVSVEVADPATGRTVTVLRTLRIAR